MSDKPSPNPRDEVELLPCPFCGGTNIKVLENYDDHPEQIWMTTHVCKGTNLEIAVWVQRGTSREEVIAKWNTRATPPTPVSTEPHRCPNCWANLERNQC